MKTNKIFIT